MDTSNEEPDDQVEEFDQVDEANTDAEFDQIDEVDTDADAAAKWLAGETDDDADAVGATADDVVGATADDAVEAMADDTVNATAADTISATANDAADEPVAEERPRKQRSDRRKGGNSEKGSSRGEPDAMQLALRRFQPCGRCSYFVADCQIYLGRDTVRTAIEDGPKEWLTLEWAEVFRRLTRESYIADDNVLYFYYDGTCPECRRRYTYLTEPHEDEQPMFRLQY